MHIETKKIGKLLFRRIIIKNFIYLLTKQNLALFLKGL